jgi:large subunit ribosomal protein L3
MKFALAKKVEMTQVWRNEVAIAVTKVKLEPGAIVQIKTTDRDGYDAVVVGYGTRRAKNIAKPQLGQMKGVGNFRYLKEFRYRLDIHANEKAEFAALTRGLSIDPATFVAGDMVKVQGESKGKGFQGGVKRHRFAGHKTTHGTKDQVRMPGSIGAGEPQHVFKGTRMAGRMGGESVTVANLEIIDIIPEEGVLLVKGALPGARNGVLAITGRGELKTKAAAEVKAEEKKEEAPVAEVKQEEEKAEVKPEEKKEEVKAEVKAEAKPEEKKEEAPVAEVKKEEPTAEEKKEVKHKTEKMPEEKYEDNYIEKFNHLPEAEREKYSQPAVMEALSGLEKQFNIDLIPALTKVAVAELKVEEVAKFIETEFKLEAAKAQEIAKAMQEKIFNLVVAAPAASSETPVTSEK